MSEPTQLSPTAVIASIRADTCIAREALAGASYAQATKAAHASGMTLVACRVTDDKPGYTLGWLHGASPTPEDDDSYSVRVPPPMVRLTWACCLGLAWPHRSEDPYPGRAFSPGELVDTAAELQLPRSHVLGAARTLVASGYLVDTGERLTLGPRAASMPDKYVEAFRRQHDLLPTIERPGSAR